MSIDLAKLTPGEWWVLEPEEEGESYNVLIGDQEDRICELHDGEASPKENAHFIAIAKNAFEGDPEALAWWEANRKRREP